MIVIFLKIVWELMVWFDFVLLCVEVNFVMIVDFDGDDVMIVICFGIVVGIVKLVFFDFVYLVMVFKLYVLLLIVKVFGKLVEFDLVWCIEFMCVVMNVCFLICLVFVEFVVLL